MAKAGSTKTVASQLDVVFDGTWVIVPTVDSKNNITGVTVYSPACGHPQGVTFLSALNPDPWPDSSSFYQLDSHGHTVCIERSGGGHTGMPISGIDAKVNHCVAGPRSIGANWDLLVSIPAGPDAWTSSGTRTPQTTDSFGNTVNCFQGKDSPAAQVSSTQTLSFYNVTAVRLLGAPGNVQALLPAPWSGSGSLIFEDEIPYIPTLQHERSAISAIATLAGLDLTLNYPLPRKSAPASGTGANKPRLHTGEYCGHGTIVLSS